MYKIDLGNEPIQEITVMLDDNTRIPLTFEYRPNQIGWFFYAALRHDYGYIKTRFYKFRKTRCHIL